MESNQESSVMLSIHACIEPCIEPSPRMGERMDLCAERESTRPAHIRSVSLRTRANRLELVSE